MLGVHISLPNALAAADSTWRLERPTQRPAQCLQVDAQFLPAADQPPARPTTAPGKVAHASRPDFPDIANKIWELMWAGRYRGCCGSGHREDAADKNIPFIIVYISTIMYY